MIEANGSKGIRHIRAPISLLSRCSQFFLLKETIDLCCPI